MKFFSALESLFVNSPQIAKICLGTLFEALPFKPTKQQLAPLTAKQLTTEWLTSVLCKNHPGLEVSKWHLQDHSRGTTSRYQITLQYSREFNQESNEAGLPTELFLKSTERLYSRLANGLTSNVVNESVFYNHVQPHLNIETPECYYAAFNIRSGASLILMEDINVRGAVFCQPDKNLTLAEAKSMCALLAGIHGKFYDQVEAPEFATIRTFPDYFRNACRAIFLKQCCEKGLSMAAAVIPDSVLESSNSIWPLTMQAAESHAKLPLTLIHSDVHLGNWYRTAGGAMGLADWQCLVKGNWSRDMAYCLGTALTPEQRKGWERELLLYYSGLMKQQGIVMPNFDETLQLYKQQLLLALAWWTGTLGASHYFVTLQTKETCLTFIHRIATAIEDHKVLF